MISISYFFLTTDLVYEKPVMRQISFITLRQARKYSMPRFSRNRWQFCGVSSVTFHIVDQATSSTSSHTRLSSRSDIRVSIFWNNRIQNLKLTFFVASYIDAYKLSVNLYNTVIIDFYVTFILYGMILAPYVNVIFTNYKFLKYFVRPTENMKIK